MIRTFFTQVLLPYWWLCVLFFSVVLLVGSQNGFAGQSDRLLGWIWSDNLGWISLNCTNNGKCDEVNYGVTVFGTGGNQNLTGWAWADNLGWIDFSPASMQAADRSFQGVAIVYSTIAEPFCDPADPYQTNTVGSVGVLGGDYTCTDASENDGWNGVISLADNAPISYGPVADATDDTNDGWDWEDSRYYLMDGYAWGGDVVGWIKFSCQDSDGPGGPDTNTCAKVGYGALLEPFYFDFTADRGTTKPTAIEYNGSFDHIWTLIPDSDIKSCVASGGVGDWSTNPDKNTIPSPLKGTVSKVTDPLPGATSTLTCTNHDGKTLERNLPIYVKPPPPVLDFRALDYNIPFNQSTKLVWTSQEIASCVASAGDSGWDGSLATGTNIFYTTEPLVAQTTTYNMRCMSLYPEYYPTPLLGTLDITVQKLLLDFYARDEEGNRIVDSDQLFSYTMKDNIELVWETEFATLGCEAGGDWNGTKVSVNSKHDVVNGSAFAVIPGTTGGIFNFSLNCKGEFGQQVERNISVTISNNPDFSEEINN